jgi:hypothetical protein
MNPETTIDIKYPTLTDIDVHYLGTDNEVQLYIKLDIDDKTLSLSTGQTDANCFYWEVPHYKLIVMNELLDDILEHCEDIVDDYFIIGNNSDLLESNNIITDKLESYLIYGDTVLYIRDIGKMMADNLEKIRQSLIRSKEQTA